MCPRRAGGRHSAGKELAYLLAEGSRVDRLGDVSDASRGERLLAVAVHRVSGERDDWDRLGRWISFESAPERKPVEPPQLHVPKDQPRYTPPQHLNPFHRRAADIHRATLPT